MSADKSGILKSFLIARGDISNLEDEEGMKAFESILGEPQDAEQLKVNLEWGKEKESFAILAARNKLIELESEDVSTTDQIRETGLTSCVAFRCDPLNYLACIQIKSHLNCLVDSERFHRKHSSVETSASFQASIVYTHSSAFVYPKQCVFTDDV
jgi:hypothetical protein